MDLSITIVLVYYFPTNMSLRLYNKRNGNYLWKQGRQDKTNTTWSTPPITSLRIKPLRDIDLTLKKQCTHPFIQGFPTASTFKVVSKNKNKNYRRTPLLERFYSAWNQKIKRILPPPHDLFFKREKWKFPLHPKFLKQKCCLRNY